MAGIGSAALGCCIAAAMLLGVRCAGAAGAFGSDHTEPVSSFSSGASGLVQSTADIYRYFNASRRNTADLQ
jgi:hypothetical protein